MPKYLCGSFPNLQPRICEKWRDVAEKILSGISSYLAKLTLRPDIPLNAIKYHLRFSTILAYVLRKIRVSSAYCKWIIFACKVSEGSEPGKWRVLTSLWIILFKLFTVGIKR
jgi:hypothetical protein